MKKLVFVLAFILVFSTLLIACSGQATTSTTTQSTTKTTTSTVQSTTTTAKPTTSSTSPGTTTTAKTTSTTPNVIKGGTMKVIIAKPAIAFGYPPNLVGVDGDYATPFWNRLVRFDEGGKINPELATSWDISADGKSITFHLRKGVKFHDGTDFDAAAVKYNIDLEIPPNPTVLFGISSVEVIDPSTVKINSPTYSNILLYQLAVNYGGYMVSPTAIQKNGKEYAKTHPVGTGPFVLKEYVPNTLMTMAKNPNYWDTGKPYLDGIEIDTITDAMTQLTLFKSGSANVMYDVIATTAAQLRDEGYKVFQNPGALYQMAFDTKSPNSPFRDPKVRMAIEYAVDKEAITSGPGLGLYTPAYQHVKPGSAAYNTTLPQRKYDPVKAKQLLKEAGYENGFTFTYALQNTTWIDGMTAIQYYLKQVGITMNMNIMTNAALAIITRQRDSLDPGSGCQVTLNTFSNEVYYFDSSWRSNFPQFRWVQKPAGVDALIDKAISTRDENEAIKTCQQISKLLYDDATTIPMWLNPRIVVTDNVIQNTGYFINGEANNNKLGYEAWLKK